MSYYRAGDFYGPGQGYYRRPAGDPGFFDFIGKVAGAIPVVGGAISAVTSLIPAVAGLFSSTSPGAMPSRKPMSAETAAELRRALGTDLAPGMVPRIVARSYGRSRARGRARRYVTSAPAEAQQLLTAVTPPRALSYRGAPEPVQHMLPSDTGVPVPRSAGGVVEHYAQEFIEQAGYTVPQAVQAAVLRSRF